ncbi:hypothetical protein [Burkholderia phage FLC9]|nr:hypothetical protein [Burkholderia phage FLC9]
MARSEFIIIDTTKAFQRFIRRTDFYNSHGIDIARDHLEEYLDSIIDGVLDAVYYDACAVSNLWDYTRKLKENCELCDQRSEGLVLAKSALELGESIHQDLRSISAYHKGKLGYYYSGRIGVMDLILARTGERQ